MKLNKFAKQLENHTLKIMKKYLEIYFKKPGKIMEISWNFVTPEKWEPWLNSDKDHWKKLLSCSLNVNEPWHM